jgi:hypothetical protein
MRSSYQNLPPAGYLDFFENLTNFLKYFFDGFIIWARTEMYKRKFLFWILIFNHIQAYQKNGGDGVDFNSYYYRKRRLNLICPSFATPALTHRHHFLTYNPMRLTVAPCS